MPVRGLWQDRWITGIDGHLEDSEDQGADISTGVQDYVEGPISTSWTAEVLPAELCELLARNLPPLAIQVNGLKVSTAVLQFRFITIRAHAASADFSPAIRAVQRRPGHSGNREGPGSTRRAAEALK